MGGLQTTFQLLMSVNLLTIIKGRSSVGASPPILDVDVSEILIGDYVKVDRRKKTEVT